MTFYHKSRHHARRETKTELLFAALSGNFFWKPRKCHFQNRRSNGLGVEKVGVQSVGLTTEAFVIGKPDNGDLGMHIARGDHTLHADALFSVMMTASYSVLVRLRTKLS